MKAETDRSVPPEVGMEDAISVLWRTLVKIEP